MYLHSQSGIVLEQLGKESDILPLCFFCSYHTIEEKKESQPEKPAIKGYGP